MANGGLAFAAGLAQGLGRSADIYLANLLSSRRERKREDFEKEQNDLKMLMQRDQVVMKQRMDTIDMLLGAANKMVDLDGNMTDAGKNIQAQALQMLQQNAIAPSLMKLGPGLLGSAYEKEAGTPAVDRLFGGKGMEGVPPAETTPSAGTSKKPTSAGGGKNVFDLFPDALEGLARLFGYDPMKDVAPLPAHEPVTELPGNGRNTWVPSRGWGGIHTDPRDVQKKNVMLGNIPIGPSSQRTPKKKMPVGVMRRDIEEMDLKNFIKEYTHATPDEVEAIFNPEVRYGGGATGVPVPGSVKDRAMDYVEYIVTARDTEQRIAEIRRAPEELRHEIVRQVAPRLSKKDKKEMADQITETDLGDEVPLSKVIRHTVSLPLTGLVPLPEPKPSKAKLKSLGLK